MKRIHGLLIALALGVAAVAGTFAALQTTSLGAQAATVSDAEIASRSARLDRAEKALRRAAKRQPAQLSSPPSGTSSHHGDDDHVEHEDEVEDEGELEHEDEHHGRGRGEDDDD